MSMSPDTFRRYRNHLGVTPREFGNIFGFTGRHIYNIENGVAAIPRRVEIYMKLIVLAVDNGLIEIDIDKGKIKWL